jgi:hypothetical protein
VLTKKYSNRRLTITCFLVGENLESDHKAQESDSRNMLDKENSVNASREKSENGFVDLRGCQVKDPSMRKWRTVEGSDLRLTLPTVELDAGGALFGAHHGQCKADFKLFLPLSRSELLTPLAAPYHTMSGCGTVRS